ncbi:MAG: CSS-motif domain-containing protein [Pseudomonadota bacterium]
MVPVQRIACVSKKSAALLFTLLVATVAIVGPIWLAVEESRKQGFKDETDRVLLYAKDVLRRSDTTADQVARAIQKLAILPGKDACSDARIALMQEVDLASSYIQAFGHVSGDTLICSSLGAQHAAVSLGPADLTTSRGTVIRRNVRLAIAPEMAFIALEQRGYVAIIYKESIRAGSLPLPGKMRFRFPTASTSSAWCAPSVI